MITIESSTRLIENRIVDNLCGTENRHTHREIIALSVSSVKRLSTEQH